MSSTIFDVPPALPAYNPENDTVMIHNLSQPAGSSTVQIKIQDLLNKFVLTDGKIKVRLIDNGEETLPTIAGSGIFTVAFNEIVIFKSVINKNDFDQVDGYTLHVFTKGKGKYRKASVVDPTATQVFAADFIQIYRTSYGDEIYPGYSDFNSEGMLSWSTATEFAQLSHQTMSAYIQRLFRDSQSKLNAPMIDFSWGGNENRVWAPARTYIDTDGNPQLRNYPNLVINKLKINISFWESFQRYIDQGGSIELLIYRRNKQKVSLTSEFTVTRRKPIRWSHNKQAHLFGGMTAIPITQQSDFYDFNAEYLIERGANQKRSFIEGNKDPQFNKTRREWLGFAFRFTEPSATPFVTPIIATLGLIKIDMEPDWPESGDTYKMITYQYQ